MVFRNYELQNMDFDFFLPIFKYILVVFNSNYTNDGKTWHTYISYLSIDENDKKICIL